MRGGARPNSGPTPDPDALRRNRADDRAGWRTLPGPYTAKPPAWPLHPDVTLEAEWRVAERLVEDLEDELNSAERQKASAIRRKLSTALSNAAALEIKKDAQVDLETEVWTELWRAPHAHAWIELGWVREVARYVRHVVLSEMGSMDDAREARQWSDRLGLNPAAMLRNRWKIAATGAPPAPDAPAPKKRASARDRLTMIDGGRE